MLTEEQEKVYVHYPELGKKIHDEIQGSKLVELEGVGHIPHVLEFEKFKEALFGVFVIIALHFFLLLGNFCKLGSVRLTSGEIMQ